jgi:hypothetical protein
MRVPTYRQRPLDQPASPGERLASHCASGITPSANVNYKRRTKARDSGNPLGLRHCARARGEGDVDPSYPDPNRSHRNALPPDPDRRHDMHANGRTVPIPSPCRNFYAVSHASLTNALSGYALYRRDEGSHPAAFIGDHAQPNPCRPKQTTFWAEFREVAYTLRQANTRMTSPVWKLR